MPIIYLSPSTQEKNYYVSGGTEEQYMNLLADKMIPYLDSSGIRYTRNTPSMTAASSIAASNAGNYDFHLALHSNAAPEGRYGTVRGIIAFYYPGSAQGQRAAEIFANNLRAIYPLPNKVRALSTTTIGEVRRVQAPAVLLEIGFHDNTDDAAWIKNNLDEIARVLVLALTEYFGIPFLAPTAARSGMVDVDWGSLNIRSRPDLQAPILARAPDGAYLSIINLWQGWYLVNYNGTIGYASRDYVTLN
ncbi:MAG: SH3 domain-containing protein [Lawsonibacter sp.]|nr:SH3 domain-containing protein [Lawsonibacter sp.]